MRLLRQTWSRFWDWCWGRVRYRTKRVKEVPEKTKANWVYLEGEGGDVWIAAFLCPCGCEELIELNLQPQQRPRWHCTEREDGIATLAPSIWRHVGCRSHFFIRNGGVIWCRPS